MPTAKTFKGTSNNLQKALENAVKAAQQSAPGADRLVEWTLSKVSGRQGGIQGLREVTVEIKAKVV